MRPSRVFIDGPLKPDTVVQVGGSAANHLARVLRVEPGDALTVFDGRGGEHEARIESLRKDRAFIAIGAHRAVERESPLAITLAQGVSRGERMDLVVQKATELGVRRIVPLITERSVVRLDAKQADAKLRHWRAVAVAACEQCGRNSVPEVAAPSEIGSYLSAAASGGFAGTAPFRIVLSPHGGLRARDLFRDLARDLEGGSGLVLLIGPEGGLSEAELDAAQGAGFRAMRLGPRVLRTETAAIAALAVVQHQLGDL